MGEGKEKVGQNEGILRSEEKGEGERNKELQQYICGYQAQKLHKAEHIHRELGGGLVLRL